VCEGLKLDGSRCSKKALPESRFCVTHQRQDDGVRSEIGDEGANASSRLGAIGTGVRGPNVGRETGGGVASAPSRRGAGNGSDVDGTGVGGGSWAEEWVNTHVTLGTVEGRLKIKEWLVGNEFSSTELLSTIRESDLPSDWAVGRKRALMLDCYDEARAKDPSVCWNEIILYKKDMKGAYTLLNLDPEVVKQFAFELPDERVVFFLCGIFGWTGTPAHFQVVTRALLWELRKKVTGRLNMYVDDFMGVCLRWHVDRNMRLIDELCEGLFRPGCIAPNKNEVGRRLPHIGFDIDLDSGLVELTERNVSKAVLGFFTYCRDGQATVVQMQRLASWGSRYSDICVFMRPFVSALYRSYTGKSTGGFFRLSAEAMRAVRVFRMFLVLTAIEPHHFARGIYSFRPGAARHVLEYDASLSGLGVIWYVVRHGREFPIGVMSVDITSLGFGIDASNQNSAEFIALVAAVFGLRWFKLRDLAVVVRGDSKTALKWSEKGRCKGTTANNAAVVFSLVVAQAGLTVADRVFVKSEDNWRADLLSRGGAVEELVLRDSRFAGVPEMKVDISAVIGLCDPRLVWDTEEAFTQFWKSVQNSLGVEEAVDEGGKG
jgi:hypothetical protein